MPDCERLSRHCRSDPRIRGSGRAEIVARVVEIGKDPRVAGPLVDVTRRVACERMADVIAAIG